MEKTIYTGKFYTLFQLTIELAHAFEAAKLARAENEPNGPALDEDEVDIDSLEDTLTLTEQTLSDGSKVYNLNFS